MEQSETTPELKNGYFELPYTSVGIINGNFAEFQKLYEEAHEALNKTKTVLDKLNGFNLRVQYGGRKDS